MKNHKPPGPKPHQFETAFDSLWHTLFTTSLPLDGAVSRASPGIKSFLFEITRLILLRPRSIAHFLRFRLDDEEPWRLSGDDLAEWPTARSMAARLYPLFRKHSDFQAEGRAIPEDFPPYMLSEWSRVFGRKGMLQMVDALTQLPPTSLRISRSADRQQIKDDLAEAGVIPQGTRFSRLSPRGIVINGYAPVINTEWFRKGTFEIQDEGSQVMAYFALWPEIFAPLLAGKPHSRVPERAPELPEKVKPLVVIDACAGAGGKTLTLADAMLKKGRVYAYDISQKKLDALKKRARRAGLTNIQTLVITPGEEAKATEKFRETADVVLVDAPCSSWGVLRRTPDIKWREKKEFRDELPARQLKILSAYAPLVKPGGRLVYGVCTFRPEETTEVIGKFLQNNPSFTKEAGGYLGPSTCDGFFMMSLRREDE